jgi:hypothetical protein
MAYVKCKVPDCTVTDGPEHMIRVQVEIDGAPIVGMACSDEHAARLRRQWATGDRYSEPVDPIWATVGEGKAA